MIFMSIRRDHSLLPV